MHASGTACQQHTTAHALVLDGGAQRSRHLVQAVQQGVNAQLRQVLVVGIRTQLQQRRVQTIRVRLVVPKVVHCTMHAATHTRAYVP